MYQNTQIHQLATNQYGHYSDGFRSLQYGYQLSSDVRTNAPENAKMLLSGTGNITHNVTRMLSGSSEQLPVTSSPDARYTPYTKSHFLSFRHRMMNQQNRSEYEGDDHEQTASNVSNPNMSISTDGSVSPSMSSIDSSNSSPNSFDSLRLTETPTSSLSDSSSSSDSSPRSEREGTSFPPPSKTPEYKEKKNVGQSKKGARTNYTNEQIQTLLKIFHETPYPDSEMMETIGKDLGIPEKKVKIWFQNKRARWRRRANELNNNNIQRFHPVSPVISPVTPYGYIPTGHMMTSSPVARFNGYYPWINGPSHQNNNLSVSEHVSTNQIHPAFIPSNQNASLQTHAYPSMSMTSFVPPMSSAQYSRTLPQQNMTSNEIRPSIHYPTNNGSNQTVC